MPTTSRRAGGPRSEQSRNRPKLCIGEHVARNYVSAIYDKIGVSNRVELALWYEARIHEGQVTPVISRYPLETAQGIKEPEKPSVTVLARP